MTVPTRNKIKTGSSFKRGLIINLALLLLFVFCLGGLGATAFADLYFNKGVSYGSDHPTYLYTQPEDLGGNALGVNTFLNLDSEFANADRILDAVNAGGYSFIRQLFPWNDIEPEKGRFEWAKYDAIVEKTRARGIQLIVRLDRPPPWSRLKAMDSLTAQQKLDVTGPPDNLQDWGDFVAAVTSRYKSSVKYFQMWNEPNLEYEWNAKKVDPSGYAQLLKVAYERAKTANPDAVVISAALAPTSEDGAQFNNLNDLKYLDQFYAAGGGKYFDIMAAQAYGLGYSPDFRYTEPDFKVKDFKRINFSRLADMHAVMEKNGDTAKPVWVTEYGWVSMPAEADAKYTLKPWGENVDEATQADYLVKGIERARREWPWLGVMNVWFLKADKALLERDDTFGQARYFALLNPDWSPRPAYTALQKYSAAQTQIASSGWHSVSYPGMHSASSPAISIQENKAVIRFNGQRLEVVIAGADGKESTRVIDGLSNGYHEQEIPIPQGAKVMRFNVSQVNTFAWLFPLLYLSLGVGAAGSGTVSGWRLLRGLQRVWPVWLVGARRGLIWSWHNKEKVAPFGMAFGLLLYYFAGPMPVALAGAALLLPLAFIRPDWMIYFAALTAPLYFHPRNLRESLSPIEALRALVTLPDPNNPAKNPLEFTLFEIIVVIAVMAWVLRDGWTFFRTKDAAVKHEILAFRWLRGPFVLPLGVFLAAAALSLLTPDPSHLKEALREFRVVIVEPLLLYLLVVRFLKNRAQVARVFDILIAGGVFIAGAGMYQFFFTKANTVSAEGVSRVISVFSHPDNLGLYLGRIIPLAVAVGFFGGTLGIQSWQRRRYLYLAALVPMVGTLLLSFSRGAWLATGLSLLVIVIVVGSKRGLLVFGLGLAALLAAIPFIKLERITSLFNFVSGSSNTRLNVWQASIDMIRDHPITGIGLDQFLYKYQLEYVKPEAWLERFTSHPHNLIFDYWLRLGIIGPIVVAWLLFTYFKTALSPKLRKAVDSAGFMRRALMLGLLGSMVDFLAHGLVDNSFFVVDLAAIFCLSFGLLEVLRRDVYENKELSSKIQELTI